jgi:anti-sigma factor ChrR (cupin superfamily)
MRQAAGRASATSTPLSALRRVVRADTAAYQPYVTNGMPAPGLHWLRLDFDEERGAGTYLLKFEPGAASHPHEHAHVEQFYIVEGELHDCDGHVFREGDFAIFEAGSHHWSHAPEGCVLLVFLKGWNRRDADVSARENGLC